VTSSAVERFPDKKEAHGPTPWSPTQEFETCSPFSMGDKETLVTAEDVMTQTALDLGGQIVAEMENVDTSKSAAIGETEADPVNPLKPALFPQ
jgi:hypothetical protein